MDFFWWHYVLITLAACGCSWINALAGGGMLILYPAMVALGLPPLLTNVSMKVGLMPGSFVAMYEERNHLQGLAKLLACVIPCCIVGGLTGSWIVTHLSEKSFTWIVPFCIMLACTLMAFNKQIKQSLLRSGNQAFSSDNNVPAICIGTFLCGIYSGYFGAGNGLILFALLSLFMSDDIRRINAVRQVIISTTHTSSLLIFAFSAYIDWKVAGLVFLGSFCGGYLGGKTSEKVDPAKLKKFVITFGYLFAIYLLLKNLGVIPRL